MLKTSLTLSLLFLGSLAFAQTGPSPAKPPVDRAKLPPNLRNLPLERMSSGALMLLNRDNNLVLPPRIETTAKGATITQEAVSGPVALDLRIGPNIRLGNDPSALPPNMRAQAEPHIARAITNEDFLAGIFQEGRFATERRGGRLRLLHFARRRADLDARPDSQSDHDFRWSLFSRNRSGGGV